jgi:TPR repeat protein
MEMRGTILVAVVIVVLGVVGGVIFAVVSTPEPPPEPIAEAEPEPQPVEHQPEAEEAAARNRDKEVLAAALIALEQGEILAALNELKPLAERGHATAQYHLWLVEKDRNLTQALSWLIKAAEQGHAEAENDLGVVYRDGHGLSKNSSDAARLIRAAAEKGLPEAQRNLGDLYAQGIGVPRDEAAAREWFRKAAEQGDDLTRQGLGFDPKVLERLRADANAGNVESQVRLARAYETGDTVAKDEAAAAKWYESAAKSGHADAQARFGRLHEDGRGVPKSAEEALFWYRKASEGGSALAHLHLGRMYQSGRDVEQDEVRALGHYRKAAETGNAEAQYRLGSSFYAGKGVPRDAGEAASWYRRAAEGGHLPAQITLALLYLWSGKNLSASGYFGGPEIRREDLRGGDDPQFDFNILSGLVEGVKADAAAALDWFRKAAEQGSSLAAYYVSNSYTYGWGTEADIVEAEKWLRRAAEQGLRNAQTKLATFYDSTHRVLKGIRKNDDEAARWYLRAAAQDEVKAFFNLGKMHATGRGVAYDPERAKSYYRSVIDLAEAPVPDSLAADFVVYSALNLESLLRAEGDLDGSRAILLRLAGRGSSVASARIAELYTTGLGVKKDLASSYMWLLIAADPTSDEVRVSGTNDTFRTWADREAAEIESGLTGHQAAEAQKAARAWIVEHRQPSAGSPPKSN